MSADNGSGLSSPKRQVNAIEVRGASMSISVGLAAHRSGESMSGLMRRADQALYDAKSDGKNRYVMASQVSLGV